MKIKLKNLPQPTLENLLQRRKITLSQFCNEFKILSYDSLLKKCSELNVIPPDLIDTFAQGLFLNDLSPKRFEDNVQYNENEHYFSKISNIQNDFNSNLSLNIDSLKEQIKNTQVTQKIKKSKKDISE